MAEESEAARLAKIEAERPHREKVLAIADQLERIEVEQGPYCNSVADVLRRAAATIRNMMEVSSELD